nr:P-II family nitrogen regulator [Thermus altitudinis]
MKLIVAIIRPEKLQEVLEALFKAEVRGLSVTTPRSLERGFAVPGIDL